MNDPNTFHFDNSDIENYELTTVNNVSRNRNIETEHIDSDPEEERSVDTNYDRNSPTRPVNSRELTLSNRHVSNANELMGYNQQSNLTQRMLRNENDPMSNMIDGYEQLSQVEKRRFCTKRKFVAELYDDMASMNRRIIQMLESNFDDYDLSRSSDFAPSGGDSSRRRGNDSEIIRSSDGGTVHHFIQKRIFNPDKYSIGLSIVDNFEHIMKYFGVSREVTMNQFLRLQVSGSKVIGSPVFLWNVYLLFKMIRTWANKNNFYVTTSDYLIDEDHLENDDTVRLDNRTGDKNRKNQNSSTVEESKYCMLYHDQPIDFDKLICENNSFVRNMNLLNGSGFLHNYAFYVIEKGDLKIFEEGGKFDNSKRYTYFKDLVDNEEKNRRTECLQEMRGHFKNITTPYFMTPTSTPKKKEEYEKKTKSMIIKCSYQTYQESTGRSPDEEKKEDLLEWLSDRNFNKNLKLESYRCRTFSASFWRDMSAFMLEMTCYRENCWKENLISGKPITKEHFSQCPIEFPYEHGNNGSNGGQNRKNSYRSCKEVVKLLNLKIPKNYPFEFGIEEIYPLFGQNNGRIQN